MALLRSATAPVSYKAALAAGSLGGVRDPEQAQRAYDSLLSDGLIVEFDGRARLP